MRNVLEAMESNGIKRIIFTSSVAVYGLNKRILTKITQQILLTIMEKANGKQNRFFKNGIKTTQIGISIFYDQPLFLESAMGNVYNLLKEIASGHFLMVGKGNNKKSMAYVGNIVSFIRFLIDNKTSGYNVYNYIDKPDFTMNELVNHVGKVLNKHIPATHFPYWLGMLGGYGFDLLALITRKN